MKGVFRDHLSLKDKLLSIRWSFLFLVTLVAGVGFASLYSAAGGNLHPWASTQMLRFAMGMAGLLVTALIDIRIWRRLAYPLFALTCAMLLWVEVKGHIGMGAQRWINFGFISLQPSEIMKIVIVLVLARFFSSATPDDVRNPFFLLLPAALVCVPVGMVMMQPDLGTALMILMASVTMFFLAGVSYWVFIGLGTAALASLPVAWQLMHDYQRKRVLTFLDPERDPLGDGYHIIQSKIALGSGGVTGKGYLQGTQSTLNFLPEKQTDFIFTLFTEEWGLVGGLALLFLYILIIVYGYVMALQSQNQFGRLLSVGLVMNFFLYIVINTGMVMGLLPVVGVPLALMSYGGTVMLSVMFGFGLLMSAYVHRETKFPGRGME